jgi:hypothetical protein
VPSIGSPAPSTGSPAPSTGSPGPVSPTPGRSPETQNEILQRQSAAINELLRANVRGFTIADRRTRSATIEVIPSKDYPGYGVDTAHMTDVVFTSPTGIGDLGLYVKPQPAGVSRGPNDAVFAWESCFKSPAGGSPAPPGNYECVDGAGVETATFRNNGMIAYNVQVYRPGSWVRVTVRNCWSGWTRTSTSFMERPCTDTLPEPPLTLDQVKAIALDPRLAM